MARYNGHKNWAHWNVALWLFNDEGLYGIVKDALRHAQTKDAAARQILASLPEKTPDGARYSLSAVRAAIAGEV
jgi:hypothetical protein